MKRQIENGGNIVRKNPKYYYFRGEDSR